MAKRVAAAVALTLGLLAISPAALGQLSPAIQADRLQVQAERQVREWEYAAALETLDRAERLVAAGDPAARNLVRCSLELPGASVWEWIEP